MTIDRHGRFQSSKTGVKMGVETPIFTPTVPGKIPKH
jgi:hypothetical protein